MMVSCSQVFPVESVGRIRTIVAGSGSAPKTDFARIKPGIPLSVGPPPEETTFPGLEFPAPLGADSLEQEMLAQSKPRAMAPTMRKDFDVELFTISMGCCQGLMEAFLH